MRKLKLKELSVKSLTTGKMITGGASTFYVCATNNGGDTCNGEMGCNGNDELEG